MVSLQLFRNVNPATHLIMAPTPNLSVIFGPQYFINVSLVVMLRSQGIDKGMEYAFIAAAIAAKSPCTSVLVSRQPNSRPNAIRVITSKVK